MQEACAQFRGIASITTSGRVWASAPRAPGGRRRLAGNMQSAGGLRPNGSSRDVPFGFTPIGRRVTRSVARIGLLTFQPRRVCRRPVAPTDGGAEVKTILSVLLGHAVAEPTSPHDALILPKRRFWP